MKALTAFCLIILTAPLAVSGQIKVESTGQVVVGDGSAPATTQLWIDSDLKYGIQTLVDYSSGDSYGVKGYAQNYSGYDSYGLYGYGYNGYANYGARLIGAGGTNAYGVYASAGSASNSNWAGYFAGSINVTGTVYEGSDSRLKIDDRSLAGGDALDTVLRLQPKSYRFKSTSELASDGLPEIFLPTGLHYGFFAQDVQQLLPELVADVTYFAQDVGPGEEDGEEFEGLALNYRELIPILVSALQEQQGQIDELRNMLRASGIGVGDN